MWKEWWNNTKIFSITKKGLRWKINIVLFVVFSKYRKFEKPKTSYILEETLLFSIIYSKSNNEDEKNSKENNELTY